MSHTIFEYIKRPALCMIIMCCMIALIMPEPSYALGKRHCEGKGQRILDNGSSLREEVIGFGATLPCDVLAGIEDNDGDYHNFCEKRYLPEDPEGFHCCLWSYHRLLMVLVDEDFPFDQTPACAVEITDRGIEVSNNLENAEMQAVTNRYLDIRYDTTKDKGGSHNGNDEDYWVSITGPEGVNHGKFKNISKWMNAYDPAMHAAEISKATSRKQELLEATNRATNERDYIHACSSFDWIDEGRKFDGLEVPIDPAAFPPDPAFEGSYESESAFSLMAKFCNEEHELYDTTKCDDIRCRTERDAGVAMGCNYCTDNSDTCERCMGSTIIPTNTDFYDNSGDILATWEQFCLEEICGAGTTELKDCDRGASAGNEFTRARRCLDHLEMTSLGEDFVCTGSTTFAGAAAQFLASDFFQSIGGQLGAGVGTASSFFSDIFNFAQQATCICDSYIDLFYESLPVPLVDKAQVRALMEQAIQKWIQNFDKKLLGADGNPVESFPLTCGEFMNYIEEELEYVIFSQIGLRKIAEQAEVAGISVMDLIEKGPNQIAQNLCADYANKFWGMIGLAPSAVAGEIGRHAGKGLAIGQTAQEAAEFLRLKGLQTAEDGSQSLNLAGPISEAANMGIYEETFDIALGRIGLGPDKLPDELSVVVNSAPRILEIVNGVFAAIGKIVGILDVETFCSNISLENVADLFNPNQVPNNYDGMCRIFPFQATGSGFSTQHTIVGNKIVEECIYKRGLAVGFTLSDYNQWFNTNTVFEKLYYNPTFYRPGFKPNLVSPEAPPWDDFDPTDNNVYAQDLCREGVQQDQKYSCAQFSCYGYAMVQIPQEDPGAINTLLCACTNDGDCGELHILRGVDGRKDSGYFAPDTGQGTDYFRLFCDRPAGSPSGRCKLSHVPENGVPNLSSGDGGNHIDICTTYNNDGDSFIRCDDEQNLCHSIYHVTSSPFNVPPTWFDRAQIIYPSEPGTQKYLQCYATEDGGIVAFQD